MNANFEHHLQASHPSTPPQRLRMLALHPSATIRARVAENCSAPPEVLFELSGDADAEVRRAVSSNTAAPVVVLWELAADPCPDVRYFIAENPHTVLEILIWLRADENPYVAHRAEKTINAVMKDGAQRKGGNTMSARIIERTLRRFLNKKERLSKSDAIRLRELILADGYVSRSERKVMVQAIENNLLDEDAFEVFLDLLLQRSDLQRKQCVIA